MSDIGFVSFLGEGRELLAAEGCTRHSRAYFSAEDEEGVQGY